MQTDILAVDVGNTSISVGRFVLGESFPTATILRKCDVKSRGLNDILEFDNSPSHIYIASVNEPDCERFTKEIHRTFPESPKTICRKLVHSDLDLNIDLAAPERVGIDRLLAAVAVNALKSHDHPAICVDSGSAITIDAISREGSFLGGVIMAGANMQARALAEQTDQLPLVTWNLDEPPSNVIGTSTIEAIERGLFWGAIGSIKEVITRMQAEMPGAQIFVTGGDIHPICQWINDAIFKEDMVLTGIALTAKRELG